MTFLLGETVDVLNAIHLPRITVMGSGRIVNITQSSDGTPLYWVDGFKCARTANVLRLHLENDVYCQACGNHPNMGETCPICGAHSPETDDEVDTEKAVRS